MIRCFEVMGEAVKHLSQDLRQKYTEIPWRQIAGFLYVLTIIWGLILMKFGM